MKNFDGIKMSDFFYEYAIYKKAIGENLNLVVEFNEDNELVAIEYPISEQEELKMNIYNTTKKLQETDYIANKLAEANTRYNLTSDKTELVELATKYEKELNDRIVWRKEIDELQQKLKQEE